MCTHKQLLNHFEVVLITLVYHPILIHEVGCLVFGSFEKFAVLRNILNMLLQYVVFDDGFLS